MMCLVGIMTVRIKALQEHNRIHPKVLLKYLYILTFGNDRTNLHCEDC